MGFVEEGHGWGLLTVHSPVGVGVGYGYSLWGWVMVIWVHVNFLRCSRVIYLEPSKI